MREEGITRHDIGREKFVSKVWEWKKEYGDKIFYQLRSLGSSLDWTRQVFTMDDKLSAAVQEAFLRMYKDGLIYRDVRLVNWDCKLRTAISDMEVEYEEFKTPHKIAVPGGKYPKYEFGYITSFAYPIAAEEGEKEGECGEIVVATTRLETMLADSAVAVHPEDPRYKHLHGRFVRHPFNGRKLPIILDAELVEMEFGTGAVKITPAHDPNDERTGKKHGLPFRTCFDLNGFINEEEGCQFKGMFRFDARLAMEKELEKMGLFRGKEAHEMSIGITQRSHDVVEPMLQPQWYVSCDSMAKKALDAVETGELEITPSWHKATWFRWLENIRDWCISRQLWWGHRIPAFLIWKKDEERPTWDKEDGHWFVCKTQEDALSEAAKKFGVAVEELSCEQDPDVLDTWFSSGLFPFSVFGWPDEGEENLDLKSFFPTSVLETGHDIIFFWVARMVMMSLHLTGKLPFKRVLLHAMVRDAHGHKMSKSSGNVVDPLDVINGITLSQLQDKLKANTNITEHELKRAMKAQKMDYPKGIEPCGTDALRFALCSYTSQGRSINLDVNRIVGYRNFCNKLWNATIFAINFAKMSSEFKPVSIPELSSMVASKGDVCDKWILNCLSKASHTARIGMEEFNLGAATTAVHAFFLYQLCDVYVERVKPVIKDCEYGEDRKEVARQVLYHCIVSGLILIHPFMPFVTETLYHHLPRRASDDPLTIMNAEYPKRMPEWENEDVERIVKLSLTAVTAIRKLKKAYQIPFSKKPMFLVPKIAEGDEQELKDLLEGSEFICDNAGGEKIEIVESRESLPPTCASELVSPTISMFIDLKDLVDMEAEVKKLEKKRGKLEKQLTSSKKRMDNKTFMDKAPQKVKDQLVEQINGLEIQIGQLDLSIEAFKGK
eukprot:gnl/Carplike_NY0171/822_a1131_712.p1 GENE.gnl/Carplike_NY0171/822_a1131_712~~gnl/Carplike_NY0171/822_a1131_712.p1  ORF type:complete len:989 (-),score=343.83 gnl/Carplike_NY0171/822_a1131_712:1347-4016(-)